MLLLSCNALRMDILFMRVFKELQSALCGIITNIYKNVRPGKSHGQKSLAGYSPWGCKELDTIEQLTLFTFASLY